MMLAPGRRGREPRRRLRPVAFTRTARCSWRRGCRRSRAGSGLSLQMRHAAAGARNYRSRSCRLRIAPWIRLSIRPSTRSGRSPSFRFCSASEWIHRKSSFNSLVTRLEASIVNPPKYTARDWYVPPRLARLILRRSQHDASQHEVGERREQDAGRAATRVHPTAVGMVDAGGFTRATTPAPGAAPHWGSHASSDRPRHRALPRSSRALHPWIAQRPS